MKTKNDGPPTSAEHNADEILDALLGSLIEKAKEWGRANASHGRMAASRAYNAQLDCSILRKRILSARGLRP